MGQISPEATERLCAAVEQAMPALGLDEPARYDLLNHVSALRAAMESNTSGEQAALIIIKAIRYALIENADGPIAAILADSAARLAGDGIGKLFN